MTRLISTAMTNVMEATRKMWNSRPFSFLTPHSRAKPSPMALRSM